MLSLHAEYAEMTLVVVSHDLASLKRIADYVLVLRDGAAVFAGTLAELERSGDEYLRQFLHREAGSEELALREPPNPEVRAALEKWLRS